MTLNMFLLMWDWALHVSWDVFVPDSAGLGNHIVAQSNWHDASVVAHAVHGTIVQACGFPVRGC